MANVDVIHWWLGGRQNVPTVLFVREYFDTFGWLLSTHVNIRSTNVSTAII